MSFSTKTETHTTPDGATVEVATIVHEGHAFTNLGAVQDPANGSIVAYVKSFAGERQHYELTTWGGEAIEGRLVLVSSWEQRIPGHRYCPRVTFYAWRFVAAADGRVYHGRNAGPSMVLRLRTRTPRAGGAS